MAIVERERLLWALDVLSTITPSRTTYPVLEMVRLDTSATELRLAATDLDVFLQLALPIEQGEPSSVAVLIPVLRRVLLAVSTDTVAVLVDGVHLEVRAGAARFRFDGVGPEEFPNVPHGEQGLPWHVRGSLLHAMCRTVSFCASRDETRPAMNGICIECSADRGTVLGPADLRVVATDGHRLAVRNTMRDFRAVEKFVVPRGLTDLVPETEELVKLSVGSCTIGATLSDRHIAMRLLNDAYPDYAPHLRWTSPCVLRCSRTELLEATERAARLRMSKVGTVAALLLSPEMSELYARNRRRSKVRVQLSSGRYEGTPLRIGFVADYMAGILQHMAGPFVKLGFASPEQSIVIEDDVPPPGTACLLMPIKDPPLPA